MIVWRSFNGYFSIANIHHIDLSWSAYADFSFKDLEDKREVDELKPDVIQSGRAAPPQCISLTWSADGQTLYAGYTDNVIRVWQVAVAAAMG